MIPIASGTAIQPILSSPLQHPRAGMAVMTGTDHWKIERVVAVAMVAIIPGSFVYDTALMNYLLAASLAVHAHWGLFKKNGCIHMFNYIFYVYRYGYSISRLLSKKSFAIS